MKVTNDTGLPQAIAHYRELSENHRYSAGAADYSVTTLIDSPRIRLMHRKHGSNVSIDASEDIFAMLGGAVHHVLEHGAHYEHDTEERLFMKVNGKTISGAIDLQEYEDNFVDIYDFKVTSVWAYIIDGLQKPDWVSQQNIYATLVEENKPHLKVRSINVVVLFRDWSKREAARRSDYPQRPIIGQALPLWGKGKRWNYITERLKLHVLADEMMEQRGEMPLCTNEDRWAKPETYALMKEGRKSALKLFKNNSDAMKFAQENGLTTLASSSSKQRVLKPKYKIEKRKTEYTRCESWCKVAEWCSQLKAEQVLLGIAENQQEQEEA